jgi:hypothetical protein
MLVFFQASAASRGDIEANLRAAMEIGKHTLLKKVPDFPVPSRDVTNQTLPGRE